MSATVGISTVYEAVQAALVGLGATWELGDEETLKKQSSPPRFVWVPQVVRRSTKTGPGGGGKTPKLQGDTYLNDIHVWGATLEDVERMRHALFTALHDVLFGNMSDEGTTFQARKGPEGQVSGWKAVCSIAVYLVMPRVVIAVSATPPPGDYHHPKTDVTDQAIPATVFTETEIDTSGATAGDDVLQGGEG